MNEAELQLIDEYEAVLESDAICHQSLFNLYRETLAESPDKVLDLQTFLINEDANLAELGPEMMNIVRKLALSALFRSASGLATKFRDEIRLGQLSRNSREKR